MNEGNCGHHGPDRLSWWELWPMLGWGTYTVYLYASGRINLYLRPIYGHLAFAGSLILLAVFGCGWVMRWRSLRAERKAAREGRARPPHAGHADAKPSAWRYVQSLAFVVPLVIGFSLPDRGLNALAALQRGAGDPAMLAQLAAQRQQERAEWVRGYAWTTVLGVAQRLRSPAEAKVGALGFVVRDKKTPPGEFLLVRFVITCCAADASPVAVPVRWGRADALKDNQWVKVYGRIDPKQKVLVAEEVEPTREPKKPYL